MPLEAFCSALASPGGGSLLAYHLLLGAPAVGLLAWLAYTLKSSLRTLNRHRSPLLAAFFGALWLAAALNAARAAAHLLASLLQRQPSAALWDGSWLLTRFAFALLELCVLAATAQGSLTTGSEDVWVTLAVAGGGALLDAGAMALTVGLLHRLLFLDGGSEELTWGKWGFWLAHSLAFLAAYTALLALPCTRLRELVPARAAFLRYTLLLFATHLLACIGAAMLGLGAAAGHCVAGLASLLYFAAFPPALYLTFLSDFLRSAAHSDVDLLLYSEMKDAGMFEGHADDF